jgi:hypothetical protein
VSYQEKIFVLGGGQSTCVYGFEVVGFWHISALCICWLVHLQVPTFDVKQSTWSKAHSFGDATHGLVFDFFAFAEINDLFICAGYPAPRRCHTCVSHGTGNFLYLAHGK